MKPFIEHQFDIPTLSGISQTNIDEHKKLYKGYVTNANLIQRTLAENTVTDPYARAEMQRRFGFEFNGMRNHEYYFASLVGGARELSDDSALAAKITEQWGSVATWKETFTTLAMTRGIGWAMLYHDSSTGNLLHAFVEEQHLGQLATCDIILALDMWEHAYVYDYPTSEKKKYIESFFANLNWSVIEENYTKANK